jgi:hypothetical protein
VAVVAEISDDQSIAAVGLVDVMLGDYPATAVANDRKAALVCQRIATDSKIVSRDEDKLYPPCLEQVLAATQHIEFSALDIAMKNIQSLDAVAFHKNRYADARHQDLTGFFRLERHWVRRTAADKSVDEGWRQSVQAGVRLPYFKVLRIWLNNDSASVVLPNERNHRL